ncbi:MAG TPA: YicC/YloC family endoribonuclease, partial [Vicinamibacteria bacterium]
MIRSMTGYGAASVEGESLRASVVARSVNHRFFDLALHLPRRLQPLESEARERVAAAVTRGRVEVSVQAVLPQAEAEAVLPSRPLVSSLVRVLRDMQSEYGLEGGVSVADLVRFPGALERVEAPAGVPEDVRAALVALLDRALDGLAAMRLAEGERLRAELERLIAAIEAGAARIEARVAGSRESRRAVLLE